MSSRHVWRGRALFAFAALSLLALPALSQVVVDEVRLPESRSVEGKKLTLNGAGLRTKVVKLYVGALYLEEPSKNAEEIIRSDKVKRIELHVLRDLSKEQVAETIREGFEKNSQADMAKLEKRLDELVRAIPAVKRGEVLSVTYVPGKGTTVEGPNNPPVTLEGEDFARAMFSIWLGDTPAQDSLKRELLRGGAPRAA